MIIILNICVVLIIIGIIIICFSYFFKFTKIEFDEFKDSEFKEDEFEEDKSDEDFYKLLGSTKHILNMVGFVFIVIGITLFFLYKYF